MAINFCSARVKTEISSPAVSCEGYDITNLLSAVPVLQNKGFLAEGFTKPPISICLKFFCNVDVNRIILWVEVGRQKSNGIELLASADCNSYNEKSEQSILSHNPSQVVRIGSCRIHNESGVVFEKYNIRNSSMAPSNFLVKYFHTSAANVLRNCSHLEIKIFSTAQSSVPSMKKIEVWGMPARNCPKDIRQNVFSLWNQPMANDNSEPETVGNQRKVCDTSDTPSTSSSQCDSSVPEEFLDPITLNIMAIPMTLPSGKSVDISTLEKYEAAESTWGRGPSDPFTGVTFSQSVFPVPNVALKSRIDQFLVANGHLAQYKGVGRTVGRAKRITNEFAESSNKLGRISGDNQSSDGASSSRSNSFFLGPPSSCVPLPIPEKTPSNSAERGGAVGNCTSFTVEKLDGSQSEVQRGLKRKIDINEGVSRVFTKDSCYSVMKNHEETVEDSLDCALQSVLTGLPSFVRTTANSLTETSQKITKCECSHCLSKDCLFTLPCKHFLCRKCLVVKSTDDSGKMDCDICHNHYRSSDVNRFHNS